MKPNLYGLLGALAILVLATAGHAGEYRTWTSRKGTSVEARFSRVSGNYVILQKTDARFVKIERSALSDVDQALLRQGSSEPERTRQTTQKSRPLRANPRPQLPVQPRNGWDLDDDEQGVVIEEPLVQHGWQRPKNDVGAEQLHAADPLNDPDLGVQNQWGWQQKEQTERWRKQEEQQRVQLEKDMIKSRAFQLEGRIRDSRHSSHADYGGMSTEAEFLSQDSSRLGESGAAWQFGNAASKLREMEREDNSLWNRQQDSFGSQVDSDRREAERDVWGGSGSINSFDSGSSMDSW